MGRVDIGDGGPPLDLPDAWLPNWQKHVKAALARGDQMRRRASAIRQLPYRNDTAIAAHSGLTVAQVAQLRASFPKPDNDYGDGQDTRKKILRYPLDGGDEEFTPAWQLGAAHLQPGRNPPRRVRLIVANPHTTEIDITITTLSEPP